MTCRCFLFEYFSQPQRLPLIFFWQNENITKQISNENNGKPLIGGFCLTRHSSYTKKRFWTTGSHVCSTWLNEAPRCIKSYFLIFPARLDPLIGYARGKKKNKLVSTSLGGEGKRRKIHLRMDRNSTRKNERKLTQMRENRDRN